MPAFVGGIGGPLLFNVVLQPVFGVGGWLLQNLADVFGAGNGSPFRVLVFFLGGLGWPMMLTFFLVWGMARLGDRNPKWIGRATALLLAIDLFPTLPNEAAWKLSWMDVSWIALFSY
ncbi:hypothetical protein J2W40_002794 [Sphingobium xenophagum]|uniref:Uncharacterized protein n=1 Tax=Sphingobium xenophagum TaxID=121428 RepID=A0ABU1X306_SPHXE|nr:hypothetical protein [Sphingobium xenophagum]MDR7155958.1 hypothetical protein [Sphingobium xenophagum]